jgi:hypothetical protein
MVETKHGNSPNKKETKFSTGDGLDSNGTRQRGLSPKEQALENGGDGGTRTRDLSLMRAPLYQLSYVTMRLNAAMRRIRACSPFANGEYTEEMARLKGFEPPILSLEGSCLDPLGHRRVIGGGGEI